MFVKAYEWFIIIAYNNDILARQIYLNSGTVQEGLQMNIPLFVMSTKEAPAGSKLPSTSCLLKSISVPLSLSKLPTNPVRNVDTKLLVTCLKNNLVG